ncbi:hypothetical protein CC2G_007337 [Coprinopsis cinerea AmutBmut pab1-1]|nr:hypothetical protein CC2G_007337 [Coprinopsis cinerea AmutBmut pab1-1]
MSKPAPPAPTHLLRSHSTPITTIWISDDNERLYSGDASGKVTVTSTRTLRAITTWNPHSDSVLGVEEFNSHVITHGRDNKLHVWNRVEDLPSDRRVGGSATLTNMLAPSLAYSMDVNALNYCRFALLPLPRDVASESAPDALIALPNLIDSSTADIWSLPECNRYHAAIGQEGNKPVFSAKPTTGRGRAGIIMSIHLYLAASSEISSSPPTSDLRLLCAYENGSVTLRRYTRTGQTTSIEGQGWETIWTTKSHVETIMSMAVSKNNAFALTTSADHLVNRYELSENGNPECSVHRIKNAGNSCIAVRDDGKVCAVGGWDGNIRLFSTKSFKPLGTLKYHRTGCQALVFARSIPLFDGVNDEGDEDFDETDKANRARWLVAGGKDNRLSVWTLMDFSNP